MLYVNVIMRALHAQPFFMAWGAKEKFGNWIHMESKWIVALANIIKLHVNPRESITQLSLFFGMYVCAIEHFTCVRLSCVCFEFWFIWIELDARSSLCYFEFCYFVDDFWASFRRINQYTSSSTYLMLSFFELLLLIVRRIYWFPLSDTKWHFIRQ